MMKSLALYYVFYLCKFLAIGYIFFRLGKKFHARNPYWHYLIPIWNYMILCRCTRTSAKYAISYHILYFAAAILQFVSVQMHEPALVNIWLSLFVMCILLEAEIFGNLAEKLNKDYWLYGFSGFIAYFPLIFLVLSKREPVREIPVAPPSRPSDYSVY